MVFNRLYEKLSIKKYRWNKVDTFFLRVLFICKFIIGELIDRLEIIDESFFNGLFLFMSTILIDRL
jgi:hypothetical protein